MIDSIIVEQVILEDFRADLHESISKTQGDVCWRREFLSHHREPCAPCFICAAAGFGQSSLGL